MPTVMLAATRCITWTNAGLPQSVVTVVPSVDTAFAKEPGRSCNNTTLLSSATPLNAGGIPQGAGPLTNLLTSLFRSVAAEDVGGVLLQAPRSGQHPNDRRRPPMCRQSPLQHRVHDGLSAVAMAIQKERRHAHCLGIAVQESGHIVPETLVVTIDRLLGLGFGALCEADNGLADEEAKRSPTPRTNPCLTATGTLDARDKDFQLPKASLK